MSLRYPPVPVLLESRLDYCHQVWILRWESWHGRSRIRDRLQAFNRDLWLTFCRILFSTRVDRHDFRGLERPCRLGATGRLNDPRLSATQMSSYSAGYEKSTELYESGLTESSKKSARKCPRTLLHQTMVPVLSRTSN
jgi:hypothetical protein